ncbi:hypothetical protein KKB18_08090 [bacterium]|nr:hypothetical protein [bacterium]
MKNTNILYIFIVFALVVFLILSFISLKGRNAYRLSPSGLIALATIIIIAILTSLYIQMQNLSSSLKAELENKVTGIQQEINEKVATMEKIINEFRKHHLRYAKINFRSKDYINAYSNYFLAHELEESLETALYIMYCCCLDENLPDCYIFFDSALRSSIKFDENLSDWLKEAADMIIKMDQLKTEIPNFNEVLCQNVLSLFSKREQPFKV